MNFRYRLVFSISDQTYSVPLIEDGAMKITLLVTLLFGLVFMTAVSAAEKELTPSSKR